MTSRLFHQVDGECLAFIWTCSITGRPLIYINSLYCPHCCQTRRRSLSSASVLPVLLEVTTESSELPLP